MAIDEKPSREHRGRRRVAAALAPQGDATRVRLRTSERKLLLLLVDIVLVVGALTLAIRVRTEWLDPPGAFMALWRWWVALVILWWLIANLLECYDLARAASAPHSIISAGAAAALTVMVYSWIPVFSPPLASRKLVLLFMLLAVGGLAAWRGLYAVLIVQPNFQQRALVLGAGQAGRALAQALQRTEATSALNPLRGTGYRIAGFLDDDAAKQAGDPVAGVPVLGGSTDLLRLAREMAVDEIVLAITHRHAISEAAFDAVLACREAGFRVTTMPALYERLFGRVPVDHVGRNVQAALPIEEGGAGERLYWLMKRLADLVLGLLALLITGIMAPFVALERDLVSRPAALPADATGARRAAFHRDQVPHHAHRRRAGHRRGVG